MSIEHIVIDKDRKTAGFHSTVGRIESHRNTGRIFFGKEYGNGHVEAKNAQFLQECIRRFQAIATQLGVPTPRVRLSKVKPRIETHVVSILMENAGPDLARVLEQENDPEKILFYLQQYLSLYQRVWDAGFPISLDPPPANFCADPITGAITAYVDFVPPRIDLNTEGGKVSEIPTPPESTRQFIEERYFSTRQAEVIYAQWLRTLHTKRFDPDVLKDQIRQFLGEEAFNHISYSDEKKASILTNPQPTDTDTLRVFAGELAADGKISSAELKRIYHLTHIEPGGILPAIHTLRVAADIISAAYRGENLGENTQGGLVVLDLDGVVTEYDGSYQPSVQEMHQFQELIERFSSMGVQTTGLTNRVSEKTLEVSRALGIYDGQWAIENGGAMLDLRTEEVTVNPKWTLYATEHVPALREKLAQRGIHASHYESSGQLKTVISPRRTDGCLIPREEFDDFAETVIHPLLTQSGLDHLFTIHIGKKIDIDPIGLNKVDGLIPVMMANGKHSPENTLFIADAPRDAEVASVLTEIGGTAAAVGNGRPAYIQAIEKLGGIIARDTDHMASVNAILNYIMRKMENQNI